MADSSRLFMKLSTQSGEGASAAEEQQITGEASVSAFAGQIELEDWNWSVAQEKPDDARPGLGAGREPGEASPSTFTFSKYMDRSTTSMLSAMTDRKRLIAEVRLEEFADVKFELVIKLVDGFIVHYQVDGEVDDASGKVSEKWTLSYGTIKVFYKLPGNLGTADFELKRLPGASNEPGESADLKNFRKYALLIGSKKEALAEIEKIDWEAEKKKAEAEKKKADAAGKGGTPEKK